MNVKPGMAGEATGEVDLPSTSSDGIAIPTAAIFSPDDSEEGKTFVWIVDEGTETVHRREVGIRELTMRGSTRVTGLQPGERIAIAGVSSLREGQQVRLPSDPSAP